jgi:phosphatidylethanolamine-binding protein (PEBP) family uncharacterized protein
MTPMPKRLTHQKMQKVAASMPNLKRSDVPSGAISLAILMDDPKGPIRQDYATVEEYLMAISEWRLRAKERWADAV